ncbi:SDR family NAD(P)-dependent oxidoreductase [Rossellomorea marisflavi]|uniref:SDR family NAD(P)-dependent oxidoreductase n=1 Tax=Rossellomorea marisflavi TaxID=189381 RepID=UPI00345A65DF
MLKHLTVIVTGAASGIGREVVKSCLQEGASVIGCDINGEGLKALIQELGTEKLHTYQLDVSSHQEVSDFFAWVSEKHPTINGLVNNAGIYLAKNLLDYTSEEVDQVMNINVNGALFFTKFFAKHILEQNQTGVIVNLSSVSGMEGSSDAVYGASKAALLGLTKSSAMNFSPSLRVNAVAPTMVFTPMMDSIPDWRKEEYVNHQLIKTPVTPEDVADTVVFLLSDKSKHYTGATFDLNNGGYLR